MSDVIVRGTAADAQVRVFVAMTKDLVQQAFDYHKTSPVVSAALGRLLTAGAMMGYMQKGEEEKLSLIIEGDGPLRKMTVTANAKAQVKGYVSDKTIDIPLKPNGKLDVSAAIGSGTLTVVKDLGLKEPYVGTTPLQTGEIGDDLTYYFTASEQIPSAVGLGVLVDTDYSIRQAGGFIIQLMPDAADEVITQVEKNLGQIQSVTSLFEEGKRAQDIFAVLTEGLGGEIADTIIPAYVCDCSEDRIRRALTSLGKEEIRAMIDDKETIEVHCDFCNRFYYFTVEQLQEILKEAR